MYLSPFSPPVILTTTAEETTAGVVAEMASAITSEIEKIPEDWIEVPCDLMPSGKEQEKAFKEQPVASYMVSHGKAVPTMITQFYVQDSTIIAGKLLFIQRGVKNPGAARKALLDDVTDQIVRRKTAEITLIDDGDVIVDEIDIWDARPPESTVQLASLFGEPMSLLIAFDKDRLSWQNFFIPADKAEELKKQKTNR